MSDDITVDETTPEQRPAAVGSPLASLRARREKAVTGLHLDLAVQRLDPPVYVRYRPVTQAEIDQSSKLFDKSKDADKNVKANAATLAKACLGVFEVIDGVEVSVDPADRHGSWPRFDQQLGDLLGLETNRAADIVRGLYLTDGDVIATATKLADWSGYSLSGLEEREAGN
jgi:hypothetical protein